MSVRDLITAGIRTGVQAVVGFLVAKALAAGIAIDGAAIELALYGVVTAVVTMLLNRLQAAVPWLGWLLSLGTSNATPSYK